MSAESPLERFRSDLRDQSTWRAESRGASGPLEEKGQVFVVPQGKAGVEGPEGGAELCLVWAVGSTQCL